MGKGIVEVFGDGWRGRRDGSGRVPFWFMRQAGRYLPEYRKVREEAGGFLQMAYDPEVAAEITMQPVRRFLVSGAILFSDILVVPDALGQRLEFVAGEGPRLSPVVDSKNLDILDISGIDDILNPVYETISLVREKLSGEGFDDVTMIGFAGAPWTVACYMVEGGSSRNFDKVKLWAASDCEGFGRLIDVIVEATVHYLLKQVEAGAELLQIFDSWAGVLDERQFEKRVIEPASRIVSAVRKVYPDIPIIGFPRGAGCMYRDYSRFSGVNGVGIDYQVSLDWALGNIGEDIVVQGNLDPIYLLAGGDCMEKEAKRILSVFDGRRFIFNLGHGVIKETDPDNVQRLCNIVREF